MAKTIGRMQAIVMMVISTGLFATMGVTVKLSAAHYGVGEIVFYRGLIGAVLTWAWARWLGVPLRSKVPGMHLWRSLVGVTSMMLWFFAIGQLPLATAVTLNYMSSVWMAVFLLLTAVLRGHGPLDRALTGAVILGFAGVVLVLRPSLSGVQWLGAGAGLLSGMLSAAAYLQLRALGRAGEPEPRVVFYFSLGGMALGALAVAVGGEWHGHATSTLPALLATGVLATVAQLLLTRAYSLGKPLINASLQYLGIVYSFAFGVGLFGEALGPLPLLGMVLIVAAGMAATRFRAAPRPA